MGKHIFEEGPRQGHAAGDSSVEQQASQLVSDIKYKVRKKMKETSGSNLSPAQVQAKYREMYNSSPAPGAVKAIAKEKLFGEEVEVIGEEEKYIIKVVDKATGNTNTRKATRAKIAELRANNNISSVEIVKTASSDGDQDGDGDKDFADIMSARMQASGISKEKANKKVTNKPYNKKSGGVTEGFSDWRSDLIEVVDTNSSEGKKSQIKERQVDNKIVINPDLDLGERINLMGGELIEMVEIDEEINFEGIIDEICDAELIFLSNDIIEEVVEEFFLECIEEGYEIETVSDMLIESLNTSLEMICEASDSYYDSAVKTSKNNASKLRRQNRIQKIKDTVKKVGKAVSHGVGYAARKAVSTAKKVGGEIKKGYDAAKDSEESSSGTRKPKTYRYVKKAENKPGLASRIGSSLKSGLKKAVVGGARAVSRGARNVARAMSEENIQEVSPPGFEGTVKAMKKHGEVDNPWALAWYMKNKGFKSHKTKSGKDVSEAVGQMDATQKQTQTTQQDQKQQKLQQQMADKPTAQERKLASIQKQQLAAKLKQVQTGTPLGEGRAMGSVSSSDTNPKGAAVRASSGSGMTMTKAAGLGKSKSTANNPAADDLRKKYFDSQAKADRRAAAKERAASGEDKLSKLIRSVQKNSYQPEGEMVDEARAEDKRGLTPTGAQRQKQKTGVVTSSGQVAHPATSYSGGQNPHLRGKGGGNKEQRRAASRRYVDQQGGVYAKPENKQGEGRYAAMQAKKRFKPDLGSKYD
jgi:hypothetical protein